MGSYGRCKSGDCGADDCTRCRPDTNAWVEDYERAERQRETRYDMDNFTTRLTNPEDSKPSG